ncbi:Transcription-repair-coupling factor [Paenibacillus allorhizoplanae]|uniref:Transcription-repair-coupling factor n=1 Tax=Paenibacillus allorhizoplanae TaxID=2905648 RepID=A0ABN8GU99_9BACL|nr:helicase-related protein [Paenibacillus allorhizoplanae]CAH1215879.1 Transcription-repair-coupling factor [Paenibacillus allorhizoplanae]
MKVQIYAVRKGHVWEWQFTIHAQTDIQYWFEHYAADAGLVLFEPFVSLGQGIRLLEGLRKSDVTSQDHSEGRLLSMVKREAAALGMANTDEMRSEVMDYTLWRDKPIRSFQLHSSTYINLVEACRGRSLLVDELQQLIEAASVETVGLAGLEASWPAYLQLAYLNGDVSLTSGLHMQVKRDWRRWFRKNSHYACKRCGSGEERMFWSACLHCGQDCPYCEECLTMGRVRSCSLLVLGGSGDALSAAAAEAADELQAYIEPWGLSDAQTHASLEGLRYIQGKQPSGPGKFLIWAVTGAGKTEMIFPFIHYTAARGGRVLIATPRKDVVLELQPRIQRAFATYSVVTLYGGSEQRWEQGQITIATTHQLLRFHQAFDLVIIDEIDAFPYHNNPMLSYAAEKVCKSSGTNILLSATPPTRVRHAAERGRLPHVRVPVRFHKHPLPVPQLISTPTLRKSIAFQSIPQSIQSGLKVSIERGAQVFVFVPNIQLVEPMVELLREKLKGDKFVFRVEGTSSKDLSRTEKVQLFRNREIRVLVTTTILERGVTVPQSDVFILDADSKLFDEAALVQMAGRAGRSKDDPHGKVYLAAAEITKSQKEAVRQIRTMNRIARKQGFLQGGQV